MFIKIPVIRISLLSSAGTDHWKIPISAQLGWAGYDGNFAVFRVQSNTRAPRKCGELVNVLAGRLRRAATFLRKVGIEVTFRREGPARTIRLTAAPENVGARPSAPSALSAPTPKSNPANSFAAQSVRTVARARRTAANRLMRAPHARRAHAREKSLKNFCRGRLGRDQQVLIVGT
jgi:hypothetical protein